MKRVKVSNSDIWGLTESGFSIDSWLMDNIPMGKWLEHIGFTMLPYRSFSFVDERDMFLFVMSVGGTVYDID